MLTVNLFIIISLINSVSTFNDAFPEIPSQLLSGTILLPERSETVTSNLTFQEYIPVACFCDQPKCNAFVKSIEPPIMGLFTRDRKIVKSLDVTVKEGELMYIILIDSKSSLGNDTYLDRISYWNLTDSQHQLLVGVPFDIEIRRQVSVTTLKKDNLRFSIGFKIMRTIIASLGATIDSSIRTHEEVESKAHYYFSASQFSQVVGIYQLFHELTNHPSASLLDFVESQKTGAICTTYFVIKQKCGFLQLLPPLLQRTSIFRQVAISLTTTSGNLVSTNTSFENAENQLTALEIHQKQNKTDPSVDVMGAVFISLLSLSIMIVAFTAAAWYYFKCYHERIRFQPVALYVRSEHSDGNQEL